METMTKLFLLTNAEGNNIAVISKKGKASPSEFNESIGLAVKEHFCVEKVSIERIEDELKLIATTLDEDDIQEIRDFTLEEISIY